MWGEREPTHWERRPRRTKARWEGNKGGDHVIAQNYIDAWIEHRWVRGKNGRSHARELTDPGNNMVDIFHLT